LRLTFSKSKKAVIGAGTNDARQTDLKIPFVSLQAQYAQIGHKLRPAVERVLSNCDFILGRDVEEFEQEFAQFIGTKYAIGTASGLDALRLTFQALEIAAGDEVILPANTFIATALAVSAVGAQPVLVDCDRRTYNVDPAGVEKAITSSTKAIAAVHLTGQPANMNALCQIASRHGLPIVEDAAQAHGAIYNGGKCGSLGMAGCFSFYPGKNLGCAGDGGMVTTNDAGLAQRVRSLRNYGESRKYHHVEKGGNSRLDTIQAAILRVKLHHLSQWNCDRASHAELYRSYLEGLDGIRFQSVLSSATHVYHLLIIETMRRDELREYLANHNIQTGIHYPIPIHLQEAYADLDYDKGTFPNSEELASCILSLPMFPELTEPEISYVCDHIRKFVKEKP
jgi:dTDP-4-amino-4,6-dideoxygalactose transaminase